jgi:hypothetical protein
MYVTIYTVAYKPRNCGSQVYGKIKEARKFYNRQRKRMVHRDVDWERLSLQKLTFKGTPRQIACSAFAEQPFTSETIEVTEKDKL